MSYHYNHGWSGHPSDNQSINQSSLTAGTTMTDFQSQQTSRDSSHTSGLTAHTAVQGPKVNYILNGAGNAVAAQFPDEAFPDIIVDLYEGKTLKTSVPARGGVVIESNALGVNLESVLRGFKTHEDWNTPGMRKTLDAIVDDLVADILELRKSNKAVPDGYRPRFNILMEALHLAYEEIATDDTYERWQNLRDEVDFDDE